MKKTKESRTFDGAIDIFNQIGSVLIEVRLAVVAEPAGN